MRPLLLAVVFSMLSGCNSPKGTPAPPPPPPALDAGAPAEADAADAGVDDEDERAWISYSADGKARLRHKSVGGRCYAECIGADGVTVWEGVGECLAAKYERRFVANDCERVVVVIPAPNRGRAWAATEVMRVYARHKLEYAVMGTTVVAERAARTSPSWVKGCFGVPGLEPRYSADGLAVEFETIEGKASSVPLVTTKPVDLGTPAKPTPAPTPKPAPKKKHR